MYNTEIVERTQTYKDTFTSRQKSLTRSSTQPVALAPDVIRSSDGTPNDITLEGSPLAGLGLQQVVEVLEPIGVDEASRADFKGDDLCPVGS